MMISYKAAKEIIMQIGQGLPVSVVQKGLSQAKGYVMAQDIFAPISVPAFDNSAMDGFAVRFQDISNVSATNPVILKRRGMIAAGDSSGERVEEGECIPIMTGAPIPQGADTIVPIEHSVDQGDCVLFSVSGKNGAHIRRRGDDFQEGKKIICEGQTLSPSHIMPLAALGINSVAVYRKPRVSFISTGRELVDDLSQPLQAGQIYNCNRPYAVMALTELGCDVVSSHTIPDDVASFDTLLNNLLNQELDFIVSSGAVSAGAFDFVCNSLKQNGADILYHKVKIKPGKPNLLAQFPEGCVYFGLPGNPVATAVGIRFFVTPFIRALLGQSEERGRLVEISGSYPQKNPLCLFQKALMSYSEEGNVSVSIMKGQESFMLHPFLEMNAWAMLPEEDDKTEQRGKVEVFPFFP